MRPVHRLCLALFTAAAVSASAPSARAIEDPDLYDLDTLRTLELEFAFDDWYDRLKREKDKESGVYIPADLLVDGVLYEDVGVRFKGFSSYRFSSGVKKPFKIKMDAFVPRQELYGYDSLRLNNCWTDPSFMREPLMNHLVRDFCPASRCNWIVLRINGENWGVYVNEQQKDRTYMREWYGQDTGNRYKLIDFGGNLRYWGDQPSDYERYYASQADDNPDPWSDLIHFCDVLSHTAEGSTLTDAMRPICDVDGTMWMLAANNVFVNMDTYQEWGNNHYAFQDDFHRRMEVMIHDMNMCFGTFGGFDTDLEPTYNFGATTELPLLRLFKDKPLKREYLHHVWRINEEVFHWGLIEPLLLKWRALIDAEVQRDPKKLYSYQMFLDSLTKDMRADGYLVRGLKPFVEGRHDFLDQHGTVGAKSRVTLSELSHAPDRPDDQETVTVTVRESGVTASKITLRRRVLGMFDEIAMQDDGQSGDGAADDGVWGVMIPGQPSGTVVEYFVLGVADAGKGLTFLPTHAERGARHYQVAGSKGDLFLNEFLADNADGHRDQNGDADDWVEVVNAGPGPVDMSGLFLTDDLSDPQAYSFPDGTVLAGGETLLVWCDGEVGQGSDHAPFKLSAAGEEIALIDDDSVTVLDHLAFGAQDEDVSTGRLFDAAAPWVRLLEPSPEALNEIPCGVRHYDARDPQANLDSLQLTGDPSQGQTVQLELRDGPPFGLSLLLIGFEATHDEIPGVGVQLVEAFFTIPLRLDAGGEFTLPYTIPNDDSLPGIDIYAQALCLSPGGEITMTNAFELDVCR